MRMGTCSRDRGGWYEAWYSVALQRGDGSGFREEGVAIWSSEYGTDCTKE